jgi:hypothetical protein
MLSHREGAKNAKQIKKKRVRILGLNPWRSWRLGGENVFGFSPSEELPTTVRANIPKFTSAARTR